MKKTTSIMALSFLIVTCIAAQSTIEEGKILFEKQKYEQASEIFSQIIDQDEENSEANYFMGMIHFVSEGDLDEAEEYFTRAIELEPDNAQYHYMSGANYGRQAQEASIFSQLSLASSCKEEFEKAVELDPKHVNARVSLIRYLVEAPGIAGGSIDDARAQTTELLQYDNYLSQIMLALIENNEENYNEAANAYLQAEEIDSTRIGAYNSLGYLYLLNLNQPDKALEQFKKLVEVGGQFANSHDSLGDGYANKKMYKDALSSYTKAYEIDPKFESSIFNIGKMNEALGNKDEAVKWYNKYLEMYEDGRYSDDAEDRLDELM